MTAGSDIANGCASSLTETVSRAESRANSARRVGSASAAKVWSKSRSRAPSVYLTIKFSMAATAMESRAVHGTRAAYTRYRSGRLIFRIEVAAVTRAREGDARAINR